MSDETTPAPAPAPEEKPAEAPQLSDVTPTPAPQPSPVAAATGHGQSAEASPQAAKADGHAAGHGDDHEHHDLPFNPWIIFFALLILTGISWAADHFLSGNFSILTISVIVMGVSLCKATLVVAFFMHYRYETKWKYVLTIPPMIVGVLIMLALVPDVGYRHSGTTRPKAADADPSAKRAPWTDPVTGQPVQQVPGAGHDGEKKKTAGESGDAPKGGGH
ncbi:MAG: cytochrome C oxidase subunit IV family protein [Planctomycetota bacterium]|jgi:cytochrome c oxidase subunit 4